MSYCPTITLRPRQNFHHCHFRDDIFLLFSWLKLLFDADFFSYTANLCSWSVTVCFTCAWNIVFQHTINFRVHVGCNMCFPCVCWGSICVSFKTTHISIGFVCVYFEFTLWTRKFHEDTLAPICWVMVQLARNQHCLIRWLGAERATYHHVNHICVTQPRWV